MRANNIGANEVMFQNNMKDISGQVFSLIETIDIGGGITIEKIRPNHSSYYYNEITEKNEIIIHSTVGILRSDIAALSKKDNHVSVSYVIGRSGKIYELFDPKYWSYHLGRGAVGGNGTNSKRSIAIELSNLGPLALNGTDLETIYSRVPYVDSKGNNKITNRDVYCRVNESEYYTKIDTPFRGKSYFAKFTDMQYKSLDYLLTYLCSTYNIPRKFIPKESRFVPFNASDAKSFSGICTHVNYQVSGKWDLGPDFDWDKINPPDTEIIIDDPIEIVSDSESNNPILLDEVEVNALPSVDEEESNTIETVEATIPTKKSSLLIVIFKWIISKLFRR